MYSSLSFFSRRAIYQSIRPIPTTIRRPGGHLTEWRVGHISARSFASTVQEESFNFGSYSVILPDEPFVFGVDHIRPRTVPDSIIKPSYVTSPSDASISGNKGEARIKLGTEEEVKVRQAAQLAKKVREFASALVEPGVTTNSIDRKIHEFILAHNAYPSPLLYSGFPRSCCTSVNNIIAHGIPDDRRLEDGDIINIDITVYLNGYHGDTSRTFLVGDVDEQGEELVLLTNEALKRAMQACGPGQHFRNIGDTIHKFLEGKDYCVSSQFTGHGIGKVFHSSPWIFHHKNDEPGVMKPGHCFTIEPAIIQGTNPRGWIFPDGWTASTENCARSAQAEHMVLITENGAEVLTQ